MGFIEEGRQLIQDFVTPEVRSIDARLASFEKRFDSVDRRVEKVDFKIDWVPISMEAKLDQGHVGLDGRIKHAQVQLKVESSRLEDKIDRNRLQIMDALHRMENYSHVLERLARLECKLQQVA
jgi:hypothetical protein